MLQSGGPLMTVGDSGAGSKLVRCHWFDESGHDCQADFTEPMLTGPLEVKFEIFGSLGAYTGDAWRKGSKI